MSLVKNPTEQGRKAMETAIKAANGLCGRNIESTIARREYRI